MFFNEGMGPRSRDHGVANVEAGMSLLGLQTYSRNRLKDIWVGPKLDCSMDGLLESVFGVVNRETSSLVGLIKPTTENKVNHSNGS
ncbi:hypothetical protein Bca4012_045366 [Brassica carinata]|uniref:Uncharacterized protein n=2 Tax=Brassica TaxID=3705 RepID=A0ABQ7DBU9_BRACR|nr:hypothetical protein DY000_02017964 [Brassica cretica]KAG2274662.1 hypothetical protein Bca52824_057217 [Brassica carinata]